MDGYTLREDWGANRHTYSSWYTYNKLEAQWKAFWSEVRWRLRSQHNRPLFLAVVLISKMSYEIHQQDKSLKRHSWDHNGRCLNMTCPSSPADGFQRRMMV